MTRSALSPIIDAEIADKGPISIADYMALALGHPDHGYYRKKDPFGKGGDFTTAPEISQMFGEMIGLALADAWNGMGRPRKAVLAEIGPGRGTLMYDALRAAGAVPGFREAMHLHFIETSPTLRAAQKRKVSGRGLRGGPDWLDSVEDLPDDAPLFLVANEFFDALPIHQLHYTANGWRERFVKQDGDGLAFTLSKEATKVCDLVPAHLSAAGIDDIFEVCPEGLTIMDKLAKHIKASGGAAIFIDYGPAKSATGDSLQALMNHQFHPVLDHPGDADITAHVDFERLAGVAARAGCLVQGPMPQGAWLGNLGIVMRAQALAKPLNNAETKKLEQALHRLIHPDQMGQLFKVLAITGEGQPPVAGFPA